MPKDFRYLEGEYSSSGVRERSRWEEWLILLEKQTVMFRTDVKSRNNWRILRRELEECSEQLEEYITEQI